MKITEADNTVTCGKYAKCFSAEVISKCYAAVMCLIHSRKKKGRRGNAVLSLKEVLYSQMPSFSEGITLIPG